MVETPWVSTPIRSAVTGASTCSDASSEETPVFPKMWYAGAQEDRPMLVRVLLPISPIQDCISRVRPGVIGGFQAHDPALSYSSSSSHPYRGSTISTYRPVDRRKGP